MPLKTNNASCNLSETIEYKCAFWNTSSNDWETFGCRHYLLEDKHFCSCNHTTNFVLLIVKALKFIQLLYYSILNFKNFLNNPIYPSDCSWCDDALRYVSIIGSTLSILFLFLSIIEFAKTE